MPVEGKTRFQYQLTGNATAAGVGGFVRGLDGEGDIAVVKINGAGPRRKQPASIDQTAFPMLDTVTGGDEGFKLPPLSLLHPSPQRSAFRAQAVTFRD